MIVLLSVIAILYGALVALVQPDMKKLIAYSSVSHMAFVTLGIIVLNIQGMDGAMLVMLAHGFNTGALFLLVGVVYERAHTRLIANFSGLAAVIPIWSGFFVLFMLASIGLPGLSGFTGEFLVALGGLELPPLGRRSHLRRRDLRRLVHDVLTQRVVWGRPKGVLPDPGDGALTPTEKTWLALAGAGTGTDRFQRWPALAATARTFSVTAEQIAGGNGGALDQQRPTPDHCLTPSTIDWHTGRRQSGPGRAAADLARPDPERSDHAGPAGGADDLCRALSAERSQHL